MRKTVNLFGIDIDNISMVEALLEIDGNIKKKRKFFVVTPNVDHIIQLQEDSEFRTIYSQANMVLADGMPLVWASKLCKKTLKEKVSGADLTPFLLDLANKNKYKVFILGAGEGVAQKLINKLMLSGADFPIDCYSPPFNFETNTIENEKIIRKINYFNPDILLVSLGAPKGEKWIHQHYELINANFIAQVGAAIDFIAGEKKRAPKWMQRNGLEWFFRLIQEPKRMFKRYLIRDSKFVFLLLREMVKK